MGFRVVCLLLCVFSVALGVNITVTGAAEGVLCRSYELAKDYGMLDICKMLWRHAEVYHQRVESLDCRICRRMIKNQNYDVFASILQRSQNFSNIDGNELRQLTSELGDDFLLCALLNRCSNRYFVLPTLRFGVKSTCNDCKKIIDDVRSLLQDNETKTAIAGYLKEAICFELPLQIVDICKRTIDAYIGVIMDLAASEMESGPTCALFGLCPGENTSLEKLKTKSKSESYSWIKRPAPVGYEFFHSRLVSPEVITDSDACTECKNVFSRIRDETKNSDFDQTLKNVVKDKLCESFGYFKSMCEAAVSTEVDSMIDNASKMNITDLCFFFNQCTQNVSPAAKALKESLYRKFGFHWQNENASVPGVCSICQFLVGKVVGLIFNNRTEREIVWELNTLCNLMPSNIRETCRRYVEDYSDFIIRQIMAGTASEVICFSLGVCDTTGVKSVSDDAECKLCELLVDTIYQKLESNATKSDIIHDMELLCSFLPYINNQCIRLVDKYVGRSIDLLVSGLPPKEVCEKLGFCSPVLVFESNLNDSCAICELVFAEVYANLHNNATIDHIEEVLVGVCGYLPSDYVAKCRSLIEQNTPAIVDLIVKKFPPRKICEELSICYHIVPSEVSGKCEVCEQIIDFIYTRLEDDATADEIEKTLETVCDYLPRDQLKATCHEYVKAYTQVLIDLLVKNLPSKEICQALHLCPSNQLVKSLCKRGPTAWCRDVNTAKLCSREAFCEEFISYSNPRPPVVRKYDCGKLTTQEERCSNERLMRLCGFEAFCMEYKRPPPEELEDTCRFCRNLFVQHLTYGSSGLDCSIYLDPVDSRRCEFIRSLKAPDRSAFENLNSVCKDHQLCDPPVKLSPASSSTLPPQNLRVPGIGLIDCSRPLSELCTSPMLRYCGRSVLESCRDYTASEEARDDPQHEMCKDRPLSLCSIPRMVELCGMGEYCEAMGMNPTPAPPSSRINEATPRDSRCSLGPSFACQTYENAVLCGTVEMCRRRFWP